MLTSWRGACPIDVLERMWHATGRKRLCGAGFWGRPLFHQQWWPWLTGYFLNLLASCRSWGGTTRRCRCAAYVVWCVGCRMAFRRSRCSLRRCSLEGRGARAGIRRQGGRGRQRAFERLGGQFGVYFVISTRDGRVCVVMRHRIARSLVEIWWSYRCREGGKVSTVAGTSDIEKEVD